MGIVLNTSICQCICHRNLFVAQFNFLQEMFEVGVFPRCTCLVICSDSVRDYVMTCV